MLTVRFGKKHLDPDSRKGFECCANDLSSVPVSVAVTENPWLLSSAFRARFGPWEQGLYATEPRARDFLPLAIHASVAHK